MATPNRAAQITKLHKVLKKHFTPVEPHLERPVLEQLLYACCLENASYSAADQAYEALQKSFFDWNEVRVSTINELAEAMPMLPQPATSAANLRRVLQSVFESTYSFDLELLKKQNLGPASQRLEKIDGATPFVVSYAVQTALSGHSIPIDQGALDALYIVGVIDEGEHKTGSVPGLERAIAKNKGFEFGSLLHQLGAELIANPFSVNLHKILLEVAPEAKDRLPKRQAKKLEGEAASPAQAVTPAAKKAPAPAAKEKEKPAAEPPAAKKKPAVESAKKPPVKKPLPAASKKKPPEMKKKSPGGGLTKRKPR
jgi:endonuclease-3